MSQTIYRATDTGYTGPWSCWTTERETAEAYTDNPGFGGATIVDATVELDRVLDLRCRHGVDFEALAGALGYDDPYETARDWMMASWRYPWEESSEIKDALDASDYEWIRYLDDYPEDADTLVSMRGVGG